MVLCVRGSVNQDDFATDGMAEPTPFLQQEQGEGGAEVEVEGEERGEGKMPQGFAHSGIAQASHAVLAAALPQAHTDPALALLCIPYK